MTEYQCVTCSKKFRDNAARWGETFRSAVDGKLCPECLKFKEKMEKKTIKVQEQQLRIQEQENKAQQKLREQTVKDIMSHKTFTITPEILDKLNSMIGQTKQLSITDK
jgi:predicted DsbA family dithiol-disulfide isomerase